MRFQRESFGEAASEILNLTHQHFNEASCFQENKVTPFYDVYVAAEKNGVLFIFTARTDDGKLVGYSIFLLSLCLHYAQRKQASETLLFVLPDHRGHSMKFIRFCDEELKNAGVDYIQRSVTARKDFSPVLKRMGYEIFETLYVRRV